MPQRSQDALAGAVSVRDHLDDQLDIERMRQRLYAYARRAAVGHEPPGLSL